MAKAAIFRQFGDPKAVLKAEDQSDPKAGPGEALIEVLAAPINPADLLQVSGQYGILPKLPAVGGNEGVGRVVALGEGVAGPAVGSVVLIPVGAGTWRTRLTAPAAELMPLPSHIDPAQLAMLSVNPPTAALLLDEMVPLQPGDWVIQSGANSGVGAYVIQLARRKGFKTVNVVRRETAVAEVKALGGDVALVDGDDLPQRVAAATGGGKVALAIDCIGGAVSQRLGDSLSPGGLLVTYGSQTGEGPRLSPQAAVFKGVKMRGFWLAQEVPAMEVSKRIKLYGGLAQLIAEGVLVAPIEGRYGLDKLTEAVTRALTPGRSGKVVLTPNG